MNQQIWISLVHNIHHKFVLNTINNRIDHPSFRVYFLFSFLYRYLWVTIQPIESHLYDICTNQFRLAFAGRCCFAITISNLIGQFLFSSFWLVDIFDLFKANKIAMKTEKSIWLVDVYFATPCIWPPCIWPPRRTSRLDLSRR